MTDLIPAYEPEGPLTVCPCCGGPITDRKVACRDCFVAHMDAVRARVGNWDQTTGRAEWARIGVQLRREGKLPPLTSKPNFLEQLRAKSGEQVREAERWGVWIEDAGRWAYETCHRGGAIHCTGTREYCEQRAATWRLTSVAGYTVKPYPDAKQTGMSEAVHGRPFSSGAPVPPSDVNGTETAPPLPSVSERPKDVAGTSSAEGGAAKVDRCATCSGRGEVGGFEGGGAPGYVTEPCPDCRPRVDECEWHHCEQPSTTTRTDLGGTEFRMCAEHAAEGDRRGYNRDPYATHRLAGERRRADLMSDRAGVVETLRLATEELARIDRELARLDRTGEVE